MLFFAQGRAQGGYLQRCPELFRWMKNLLKPVRVVQAEKPSSYFRIFLKPTALYSKRIFYSEYTSGERAVVWVYLYMRKWLWECTSISAFLRYPFFSVVLLVKTRPRYGVQWKEHRLWIPALPFTMCVTLPAPRFLHAWEEDIYMFRAKLYGKNEIIYTSQTIAVIACKQCRLP